VVALRLGVWIFGSVSQYWLRVGETWLPVKTKLTAGDGGVLRRYLHEGITV
jgi:hypothetical protein